MTQQYRCWNAPREIIFLTCQKFSTVIPFGFCLEFRRILLLS
nr:MAG TPA: hypothetical protein [Caudoviricetes sp.]